MPLSYSDADIQAHAVKLGLIAEGEDLPRHLRSKVVAALHAAGQAAPAEEAPPAVAKHVEIRGGVGVWIDGRPCPWIVHDDPIEITRTSGGAGYVRLTLPAERITITESENRA